MATEVATGFPFGHSAVLSFYSLATYEMSVYC